MAYHYKESTRRRLFGFVPVLLDVFFCAWVLMKIWNQTVTDILDVKRLTYTNAILLRFGYSALTSSWFSGVYLLNGYEKRFDDYANMISTRFTALIGVSNTCV